MFGIVAANEPALAPEPAEQTGKPGKDELPLIEVPTGAYFGEDDIVRYEDFNATKWPELTGQSPWRARPRISCF